ncbi:MAG: response regulator transcription factor [Candidatus Pacebacteria bacterium]|nr:response regulator transcription factor [Candidatus Paceibacterota bacterium]
MTKKSRLLDKINGLEKGADDYLPKPFSLAELRLKVKNMLTWELKQPAVKKIDLGLISFLPESGSFITPDGDIYLRKREKDIIFYLIQAAGRTVSRNHLLRTIWRSEDEAQLNTIDVYIRRLRRKLGKYHTIIQTRRGFGYKIVEFQ